MIQKAAIANDDFIVSKEIEHIYNGEITVDCNAILQTFLASKQSEIEGGILYSDGCPGLTEAGIIVVAKLKKVVYNQEPNNSDEMCAIELLKEKGITTIYNPNIIL